MDISRFLSPLRFVAALMLFGAALAYAGGVAAQIPGLTPDQTSQAEGEGGEEQSGTALENLLEVLRDDEARAALIEELEQAVAGEDPQSESAEADAGDPLLETTGLELRSMGAQIAGATGDMVANTARSITMVWQQLANAPEIFAALSVTDLNTIAAIGLDLSALIVISYGGFLILRALSTRPRTRLRQFFDDGGWIAKPVALILEFVLDAALVVVPYAIGYAIAVAFLGAPGEISISHSLYLNAFLITEIGIAVVRSIISPNEPEQRLLSVPTATARTMMVWARVFIGLFVYGQFLALPLVNQTISFAAGRAVSVLLMLVLLVLAAVAILRARRPVSHMLMRTFRKSSSRKGVRMLIGYWHIPALVYVAGLAIAALANPSDNFHTVLLANGRIALAILIGMIVTNVIAQMIGRGVSVSPNLSARVPLLERRLNAFVPVTLTILRYLVIVAVAVYCLHTLGWINSLDFLESQFGARMTGGIITVAIILFFAFALWLVLNSWVDYRINPDFAATVSSRERTLLVLLRNAVTITLIVITLMFVLSEVGINIAPLLASAGVIGLAIGFGAQKLVQDIITGIFIQLEGAIDVGDVVSIGGISGVVERLTIRSASLRDLEGSYHIIPFSSVDTVTNFMRGFSYALIDMGVGYRENTEEAKQALFDAFAELRADPEHKLSIIDDFEWLGVNSFGSSEVVLRARIKTLPGKQWAIRRAYNAIVKRIFDERDIEIPFPHQTLYFGVDKTGKAPPMHMVRDSEEQSGSVTPPAKPEPAPKRRTRRKKPDPDLPDIDAGPESER